MFRQYYGKLLVGLLILALGLVVSWQFSQVRTSVRASAQSESKPGLWVTPLELDLGPVGVGDTSATQTVTITNVGDATLTNFAGGGVNAPFYAAQNCASGVPPGASCQYFFSFSPTASGVFSTTSNSSTNAGPITIILRGTGAGPELTYSPLSLDFGILSPGSTSDTQVVTIRNTGLAPLTNFAGGGVEAPFSAAQNCAGGVPPGESCQYFFTFAPTTTGAFTATSSSSTNGGPITVDLQGRGQTIFPINRQLVTPLSLDFGLVGIGTTSHTLAVTITNRSFSSSITSWAGGGVGAPFSAAQNCASGVPPGASCQFFYTFSPTETGIFSTTSNVANSFGSFSIALRGTGVGASHTVSPLWLDFGPVPLNTTSAPQSVTIRNTGPITLTNFAGGGVGAPFSAAQNCAGGVPPGDSCQYFFTFTPTAEGRFTATSSSSSNGGPFVIRLQGGVPLNVYLPVILR
ncbi:MAG: choice-of-anchor D domain-containing protein [Anaerolineales bacterium]